jgi:hypothetical protein
MGAICVSNTKTRRDIDKRLDLDFEYFRENLKDPSQKLFEVKAKLWEIVTTKQKIKNTLVSKYLFFYPDGKFLSRIKNKNSEEEILLDGHFDINGNIKITLEEKVLEKNSVRRKNFEGKISQNDENGILFSGSVVEKNEGEEDKTVKTFLLDFTNVLWVLHSEPTKTYVFLYNKGNYFIGISHNQKGFAIWNGIEKGENNVILVQRYFKFENSGNSDDCIVTYHGVYDKLENFISGDIIDKKNDKKEHFKLQRLNKPPKSKKKI